MTYTEKGARMTEKDLIIQDLRRENAELRARVPKWISVDDRLPESKEEAICINADGDMMIGTYTEWGWMFPYYFEKLTHWMPMPEPPKGK